MTKDFVKLLAAAHSIFYNEVIVPQVSYFMLHNIAVILCDIEGSELFAMVKILKFQRMAHSKFKFDNDDKLLPPYSYMMIAPTIQQTRCKVWMKRYLPTNGSVTLSDVTSMYTAICVMGPFTRNLMSELTDTDLSPSKFPFFTFKVF